MNGASGRRLGRLRHAPGGWARAWQTSLCSAARCNLHRRPGPLRRRNAGLTRQHGLPRRGPGVHHLAPERIRRHTSCFVHAPGWGPRRPRSRRRSQPTVHGRSRMPLRAFALVLSCAWALFAAVPPVAAATASGTPAEDSPRGQADARPGAPATAAAKAATPGALPARKSHLRFRGPDSTCGCTCASGGTTERAIQEAHETRERAARR